MVRGLANVLTCPLELLRNPTYDGADHAMLGALTGVIKGTFFTFGRLWGGLTDLGWLGCAPAQLDMYQQFNLKDYVWQEKWWPERPATPAEPKK
jgi:hypothetical protein